MGAGYGEVRRWWAAAVGSAWTASSRPALDCNIPRGLFPGAVGFYAVVLEAAPLTCDEFLPKGTTRGGGMVRGGSRPTCQSSSLPPPLPLTNATHSVPFRRILELSIFEVMAKLCIVQFELSVQSSRCTKVCV